ncbi:hypothetical protein [Pseudomonas koreensis]|nr:hypothetical protein [Pseudomonas koreensis]
MPMHRSDKTCPVIITALDRRAFAASADLAPMLSRVYQQGFIPFECLP